jgi:hypothetical protein
MRKTPVFLAALLLVAALPVAAQQPGAKTTVASEPGKAAAMRTGRISAQVVGIDKASRVVTLKGPKGRVVDVVAGDEVRNVDQIKVGDVVVVRFMQALSLALKKTQPGQKASETSAVLTARPGERPSGTATRQVTVIADVTAVNRKANTITLKGPKGKVVTLDVQNPDQFEAVKVGDRVEAVYTEALAISVEPAAKKAAAK